MEKRSAVLPRTSFAFRYESPGLLRVRIGSADVDTVEIDRRILIFDGPDGELQQLALDLIGREFEVHYANDIDEAQILARESKGRINAVLFSASDALPAVRDIVGRFGISPAALIPAGRRPTDRVIAALFFHGVRWHLWDSPPDESIRLVISSVLFEQDPLEIRFHRRAPTSLAAQVEIEGAKSDTTIRDISLGGACLLGDVLGSDGDQGLLSFSTLRMRSASPFDSPGLWATQMKNRVPPASRSSKSARMLVPSSTVCWKSSSHDIESRSPI